MSGYRTNLEERFPIISFKKGSYLSVVISPRRRRHACRISFKEQSRAEKRGRPRTSCVSGSLECTGLTLEKAVRVTVNRRVW